MIISVTGHRPNKLYGYDLSDPRYQKMKETFKKFLKDQKCTEAITGMALGADQLFALAVLELKDEGYPIRLHCAIPCRNHPSKWPAKSQELYRRILERADQVRLVSDAPYSPALMQRRNEYMVDRADIVLAVWDGDQKGGTWNCVEYARDSGKQLYVMEP